MGEHRSDREEPRPWVTLEVLVVGAVLWAVVVAAAAFVVWVARA